MCVNVGNSIWRSTLKIISRTAIKYIYPLTTQQFNLCRNLSYRCLLYISSRLKNTVLSIAGNLYFQQLIDMPCEILSCFS